MVIFGAKKKIKELENKLDIQSAELKEAKEELSKTNQFLKELATKFDELKDTVDNLSDSGDTSKSAQQLLREYFFGEEDKK